MTDVERGENTYSFSNHAVEVISGRSTIKRLGPKLGELGLQRAMVICGPSTLRDSDVVRRTESALGSRLVGRFAGVRPHQILGDLCAARDAARRLDPDVLVSVGGGSSITAAKVVALMLSTDHDISEYQVRFAPPDRMLEPEVPLPPIRVKVIAVSTTMGGADLGSGGGGYTELATGRKITVFGRGTTSPIVVLVDGCALATTPHDVQSGSTIGQMRVAVESFSSTRHNPVSDALALHSLRMLTPALGCGWRDGIDDLLSIKAATMLASLSGQAHGAGKGINTAIAQTIGAQFNHVAHGDANAVVLPHTMRFNAASIPAERFAMLREALGIDRHGGLADPGDRVADLCRALGRPARLRDLDMPRSALAPIAAATFQSPHLAGNPARVDSPAQIVGILESAW